MSGSLLVLGGTRFVGRAVVDEALAAGRTVTTFNRGNAEAIDGVEQLFGDRLDAGSLGVLRGRRWDAAIDTWAGAPRAVLDAALALKGAVGHFGYVSSRSVYAWPIPSGADESAPVVAAAPDAAATEYSADKRGGELAVEQAFGDGALSARAGLILGPHEDIGRLPWWLLRIAAERGAGSGGRFAPQVLAPGTPDRPLQLIDARDLARWMLAAAERGVGGAFNAVSQPGHTTMGALFDACIAVTGSAAELVWVDDQHVLDAGIEPWTELPIWVPRDGELAALHDADVGKAFAAGLRCRPVEETVADTWQWLLDRGLEPPAAASPRAAVGLSRERAEAALESWLAEH